MNQTLIHSLVPGIPGLGSIALVVFMLLTAVGAVFFAFHPPFIGAKVDCRPRRTSVFQFAVGYSRRCGCFWHRCGTGLSAVARKPAGCGCAIVGESIEPASRRAGR